MLLLLAIFALVPAAHGCTVTIEVTNKDGDAITTSSVVRIGQSLTITCVFVEPPACASKTLQIGEAVATEYTGAVTHAVDDVANIKYSCGGTADSAVTPAELELDIRCQDPANDKITAVLSYDATDKKMKLVCDAQSDCAKAAVYDAEGEIKDSNGDSIHPVTKDATASARFKNTYLSTATIEADALSDEGYTGKCTYGDNQNNENEKTVTFCPKNPVISFTDATGAGDTTPTANGEAFTVKCNFQSCTHGTFSVDDTKANLQSGDVYAVSSGVDKATKYTCMNGDDKIATTTVKCEAPTISLTKAGAAITPIANGESFTVECDYNTCKDDEKFFVNDVPKVLSNVNKYEETTGVDTETEYKCMSGSVASDAVATTVTVKCEAPTISLTKDAADITPIANGEAFTVACDFKSCKGTEFLVNGVPTGLTNNKYEEAKGVLNATEYKCMSGSLESATTVKCMAGMTVLSSVGGVCKETLTPITCTKQDDGTYKKSCDEADTKENASQCRCPASKPYYHIADGKCEEKCGARGIFVSMILVVAAFLRFL